MPFFLLTVESDLTFNDFVLYNQTGDNLAVVKLKRARQVFQTARALWIPYGFKLFLQYHWGIRKQWIKNWSGI